MPSVFHTYRRQNWRTSPGGFLPVTCITRRQVRDAWCVGAVGAFYLLHACSVFFLPVFVFPFYP